jgi:hypothetical protein
LPPAPSSARIARDMVVMIDRRATASVKKPRGDLENQFTRHHHAVYAGSAPVHRMLGTFTRIYTRYQMVLFMTNPPCVISVRYVTMIRDMKAPSELGNS